MVTAAFLDPVLQPLLGWGPLPLLLIVGIFVSVFTSLIQKYATDQEKLKALKADMKRYQKKATQLMKQGKPEKAKKVQKSMMGLQSQLMRNSMKSMLYTFIPIIIFIGWLGANLTFAPIVPGDAFMVSAEPAQGVVGNFTLHAPDDSLEVIGQSTLQNVSTQQHLNWSLKGQKEGSYDIMIRHEPSGEEQIVPVLITTKQAYNSPVHQMDSSAILEQVKIHHDKLYVFKGVPVLGSLPWIKNWGWLGAYILFSLVFSLGLRKVFKLA